MPGTDLPAEPSVTFRLPEPQIAKAPGEYFTSLRTGCLVAHTDAHGGFWLLSRYEDVREAAMNTMVFSNASGVTIPPAPNPPSLCLEQDDPEHRTYRRPMQNWFSSGRMVDLESDVREVVTERIDGIIDAHEGDLATEIAEPVPATVIGALMGLPRSEWPFFKEKNSEYLRLGEEGDLAGAKAAVNSLVEYLSAKLDERREHPADDILSDILAIDVDGTPISAEEALSIAFLLLAAGHETTVGAIGGMLYHVARNVDIRDRLLADPKLIERAIEEALRLEPPLMGLGRITRQSVVVNDTPIPVGERVMLLFGAANRDPGTFEDPEEFRLDRGANRHMAFGHGIHRCVGAPLARLEMRVVLEEVLRRMPAIQLRDESDVTVNYTFSRSFRSLPVSW